MLLAIDAGNTRVKVAVFENNDVLETAFFANDLFFEKIQVFLKRYPKIEDVVLSSVGKLNDEAVCQISEKVKINTISRQNKFPFVNKYATPETLGLDRMVLASGAVFNFPAQNRLVIDAGTCITYDFINENDHYLGGAISPGIFLRYKSMNDYTANLPLLTLENQEHFIGKTTVESMHSGVINGVVGEIEGFIERYQSQYSNFTIILTGGDAEFLAKRLKNTIFANSNFLLESLNHLFQFNNRK